MKQQITFLQAKCRRTFFCITTAAATMRAWRAALVAALRPAAVVRLKRVRTSHMRTQLCTTVALRFLHPNHHKLKHIHHTHSTFHTIPPALLANVFIARLVGLPHLAERTILLKPCCQTPAGLMHANQGITIQGAVVMHAGRLEQWRPSQKQLKLDEVYLVCMTNALRCWYMRQVAAILSAAMCFLRSWAVRRASRPRQAAYMPQAQNMTRPNWHKAKVSQG